VINALTEQSQDHLLVLDDYHVNDSTAILQAMSFFLWNSNSGCVLRLSMALALVMPSR
jgi:ATP/maltotriose-dependent transcriptional regulator MalT